jgi:hypothetical protein
MKPEIILPYNPGTHNEDLAKANSRLTSSQSYKNLSTVIVCPTRGGRSLCPRFVSALSGLMRPMNQQCYGPIFMSGMEVGAAFSSAIEAILANPVLSKFKFLLTIEDDNIPPPDGLLRLYEGIREFDAVGGLYWTKGEGGQPMIYGQPGVTPFNFVPQAPREGMVQPCNGLGMGFTLFRMSVFTKLDKPWFTTVQDWDPNKGGRGYTQDLHAFERMAKLGMKVACDTRVRVGHLDVDNDQLW